MQITETILARVVLFGEVRLLNPAGLSLGPIHSGLLQRYKFLIYPINPGDFDFTKGVRYSDGEFKYGNKAIAVSLVIYTNGWVVETLVSTEASEAFWNDIAEWVVSIGFRPAKELITNKVYESDLVIRADVDLDKSFDNLRSLTKLVAELSANQTEQLSGFYIGAENSQLSTFTFERRVGVPFSENKYFSRASLPTSKHLRALEELEKLLR